MKYQQAIITGASSGFGAAYARALAPECGRLILVARRGDKLQELAQELQAAHPGVEVLVQPCDLASAEARQALVSSLKALPVSGKTLLVNNAGLGDYGEFASASFARNHSMMQVNMQALVELCHAFIPLMKAQGGGIINIASLAADLPIPDFAIYAASKAFVASFSEALRLELAASRVPVIAVCPGPVHTGFGEVARRNGCSDGSAPFKKWFYTAIPTVVQGSLRALERGKARFYPSLKIRLAGLLVRNTPLPVLRFIMGMRPRKVTTTPSES
ncbi:MAG: SDR family oxidoreductase [Akkermansia sp.]|nr:SDR family oxidoreductase [Akkermansia sp.]